jgi:hypothetical protein
VTVPTHAEIRHDATGEVWQSPNVIDLERRRRHLLVVHKDGYEPQQVYIRSEANIGWWIFDAFSLGIGNLLDAAIGGLFDLKPDRVHVVLERGAPVEGSE